MSQHISDQVLTAFRNGDRIAFDRIYDFYYYTIYGFANYYLKNQAEAEDITAETFIKLWVRRERFATAE